MKAKIIFLFGLVCSTAIVASLKRNEQNYHPEFNGTATGTLLQEAKAYPPAVGILSNSTNCLSCHINNGPWNDDKTIVDIIDKATGKSLKGADGNFVIDVQRNQTKTFLTVIGRHKNDGESPYRNAWIYVDPTTIGTTALSKFAPGWETNLQLSCRVVGDNLEFYKEANISALPMTIRPSDAARDAELQLQVMLTKGESVKGKATEGMKGNYLERKVKLIVKD
jgi:hypothetical protein